MIIPGENYYRIMGMHSQMQTHKVNNEVNPPIQAVEQADKDSGAPDKPKPSECAICPDHDTEHCRTCLTGKQIYV